MKTPYFTSLRDRTLAALILVLVPTGVVVVLALTSGQTSIAVIAVISGVMLLVSGVVIAALLAERVETVTRTAQSLAAGQNTARTAMQPTDEVGRLGHALDQYAESVQQRHDKLRAELRRQRREITHLLAVLESLPDGVIVQDLEGRVTVMNERARRLLGSRRVFRSAGLHELSSLVTDKLGPVLAPGLYLLGDPRQVELDGQMLSAQAAAVMTADEHRLGTVILLRDITAQVRQERARDAIMEKITTSVQQPLGNVARDWRPAEEFAREMQRKSITLQKTLIEMREVSDLSLMTMERGQHALSLETLISAITNEWRQVAQASQLKFEVSMGQRGLFVLGDERRLRWAIGNLIDNAIKYTPPGGTVMLEVHGEENNLAQLRIRDNGTGILPDELPHVFTRFYRGTPTRADGTVIHVPGMGQGLYMAQQIIEAHGGAIRLKSKPGIGTAVYFTLPVTAAQGLELPVMAEDIDGETYILNPAQHEHDA